MPRSVTTTVEKPALDETSFQQLLAAAHVLQEQNDRPSASEAENLQGDYAEMLAEIVQTQSLIQTRRLDLKAAAMLIAERVQKATPASGVAIAVLAAGQLTYHAGTGTAASEVGRSVAADSSLCSHCLRSGEILHCPQTNDDARFLAGLCQQLGVTSLVAVPVYHEGKVVGVLELRSVRPDAFSQHDVRTCQLMAGLVTEAIARATEREWKQTLAAERATLLEALEKIKPQLERLMNERDAEDRPGSAQPPPVEEPSPAQPSATYQASPACRGCGHLFEAEESFCGICGTARKPEASGHSSMQSKWASLWHIQQAANNELRVRLDDEPDLAADTALETAPRLSPALEEIAARFSAEEDPIPEEATTREETSVSTEVEIEGPHRRDSAGAFSPSSQQSPWRSARSARAWLMSLEGQQRSRVWLSDKWRAHRANIYLGLAALLLLAVFFGWGAPRGTPAVSASAAGASAQRQPARPNLTFFEQVLVNLGLAEPPPTPVYQGNPDTRVWVDLRTALYYCPGAESYGKTPDGKFTSQRDAQQSQFEPAFRKACN